MAKNYIHRLQDEVAGHEAFRRTMGEGLTRLRAYLTSPKFHEDPTVQVADVLHRLEQVHTEALRAEANPTD